MKNHLKSKTPYLSTTEIAIGYWKCKINNKNNDDDDVDDDNNKDNNVNWASVFSPKTWHLTHSNDKS